jgi:hypothetical protein
VVVAVLDRRRRKAARAARKAALAVPSGRGG